MFGKQKHKIVADSLNGFRISMNAFYEFLPTHLEVESVSLCMKWYNNDCSPFKPCYSAVIITRKAGRSSGK